MPFETFVNDWLKGYGHKVKISSIRVREKEMKHFISAWGPYPIKRITKKIYQNRLTELSGEYNHNYVSGIHACGRMIFRVAVNGGIIKVNPTENVQLPKRQLKVEDLEKEEEEYKFLEEEEEEEELTHFLRYSQRDGLEMDTLIFTTLAYTGLRIGELLALKWTDVDFSQGNLRVTKNLYNPNNHIKKYIF